MSPPLSKKMAMPVFVSQFAWSEVGLVEGVTWYGGELAATHARWETPVVVLVFDDQTGQTVSALALCSPLLLFAVPPKDKDGREDDGEEQRKPSPSGYFG